MHKEFVSPESTVNGKLYKNVLERLCKIIVRVGLVLWKDRTLFQLRATTLQHTTVTRFSDRNMVVEEQLFMNRPSYSLHSSRPYYFVFPKLKTELNGNRFSIIGFEIRGAVTDKLKDVPDAEFSRAMEKPWNSARNILRIACNLNEKMYFKRFVNFLLTSVVDVVPTLTERISFNVL